MISQSGNTPANNACGSDNANPVDTSLKGTAGHSRTESQVLNPSQPAVRPQISFWISLLMLAGLSCMWGFAWPVMKIVLAEVPPLTFRMYCTVFSSAGFIILIRLSGISLRIPRKEIKPILIVSSFNITLWYIFSAFAVARMPAGRAAIIAYTMPVWAAIWSVFLLKDRLTMARCIGLFLGIAGITLLIGPDIIVFKTAPAGAILMLCAAMCWAAGVVTSKYFKWTMPTILFTCWNLIIGGIPFVAGAIIFEPSAIFSPISFKGALALAYVILLGNILSYWVWFKILTIFPATVASIGILMTPVIGVFSSSFLLGELLGFREIAALVLVLAGIAVVLILPEIFRKKFRT